MNRFRCTGVAGVVLLALAVVSWTIEKLVYGGKLDADGIVQESFFLPLGFMLAAAGFLALILACVFLLHHQWRATREAANRHR